MSSDPPQPSFVARRMAALSHIVSLMGLHRILLALGLVCGFSSLEGGLGIGFFGGCCMIAGAIVRGQS